MAAIQEHQRGVTISIQVQPRASRTEVMAEQPDSLKVRVAAPPVDGAANGEIVAWLSKQLGVPKSNIEFLSGERGRRKVILVDGLGIEDARAGLGLV